METPSTLVPRGTRSLLHRWSTTYPAAAITTRATKSSRIRPGDAMRRCSRSTPSSSSKKLKSSSPVEPGEQIGLEPVGPDGSTRSLGEPEVLGAPDLVALVVRQREEGAVDGDLGGVRLHRRHLLVQVGRALHAGGEVGVGGDHRRQ